MMIHFCGFENLDKPGVFVISYSSSLFGLWLLPVYASRS